MTNRDVAEATIVALDGEFDLAQRQRVNDAFEAVADDSLVVIDLERAQYIDSTVLSCLIRLRRDLTDRGGTLVLARPRPMVKRLLEVAGLSELFDIRPTLAEVCESHQVDEATARRVEIKAGVID